ncbi:endo-1,4-beta-xylanase [Verticillium alfalfae VaMs.102]|uniref:Endo-1,5-alpha-L-arabinanase A n=1 Tax=Verticillium alfalfae (strain VaMs.102 / ATCC MYA-4576 / FGSC 10136) TaxID=526221 RepID=C9SB24_VERA1|nr:endo-1,4-beta-xylanase [Verticillium alfalfae VaMs.102]EEY15574.1 endo-1,4-beta-xylanase [Verticillium alfalfae VaMs.102]
MQLRSPFSSPLLLLALADVSLAARAEEALAALSLVNIGDVRGNIHLPAEADGLAITWHSSNADVLATDGVVKRQSATEEVVLTASVEFEGAQHERQFNASVRQAVQLDAFEAYAFSYFTGSSLEGENIFFAASNGNDALSWQELNGGQPVLRSKYGTKGLRDPFIIRSPEGDTFYMIATDLSIGSGTSWDSAVRQGSLYLEVWESNDLINWSEQRHILVSPETAGNTWAPEAFWDAESGSYAVFWASSLYAENDPQHTGSTYHRMLYSLTRDFVTFSEPKIWQDAGDARIDTTVLQANGVLYRFTKDEGSATGCRDIIQETSDSLLAGMDGWTTQASCIGRDAGLSAVEGPTAFRSNPNDVNGDKFYLFADEYGGRGYIPLETTDLNNPDWKVSASYSLPTSPRHGTVIGVTAAEHQALVSALSNRRARRSKNSKTIRQAAEPVDPIVNETLHTVIFPVVPGTDVTNLAPTFVTADGVSASPESGTAVNLSSKVVYTITNSDGSTTEWALSAVEMRSPVLPGLWADPNIAVFDNTYYLIGHNAIYDRKTIGVAVADHPEGPFTAEPEAMILNDGTPKTGQAIDPATFEDPETGKWYIYWGNGNPGLVAELGDDMVSLKAGTTRVLEGLVDFREGVFMNYRDGVYHLTYSIDDTGSVNYRVGYATADNALGPFTYHGVILEKDPSQGILGTGHSSVLNVPGTDDWYIVYHRFGIPGGGGFRRETTIDRLEIDGETGLFKKVTPTLESVGPHKVPVAWSRRHFSWRG